MFRGLTKLTRAYHQVKNMKEFNKLVQELNVPYVIDFYADWCGPCKALTPTILKLEKEADGKWALLKVNVDEEDMADLVEKHHVSGVPTLAFYKGAQKIHQISGAPNEAQLKQLEKKYLI